jgi:hypothetical protein
VVRDRDWGFCQGDLVRDLEGGDLTPLDSWIGVTGVRLGALLLYISVPSPRV